MVVQELIAKLSFQVDQTGMTNVDRNLESMAGKALKFGAILYAAKQAADAVMYTLKTGSDMENLTTGFKVILGNLEAAKYLMQEINEYANVSPFETEGVARGVKLLMAAGVSANDSLATIKKMGDIALGDQSKLDRLALVVSQVKSLGRLQGQDLMQMAQGASFNPLRYLAEMRHVSEATLRKQSEKGEISYQDLLTAIDYATSKGQMFYKGADEGAKTLSGLWSTLTDNFKLGLVDLAGEGTPLYTFFKNLVAKLIELSPQILDAWRQLSAFMEVMLSDGPTAEQTAVGIASAFMAIADAIMAIGAAFQFAKLASDIFFMGVSQLIGGVIDAFLFIPKAIMDAASGIIGIAETIDSALPKQLQMDASERAVLTNAKAGMETFKIQYMGGEGYGAFTARATENGAEAVKQDWDKFRQLSGMIGKDKMADPSKRVGLTPEIEAALAGKKSPPIVTVTTNTNIYADGALKDILEEQANDIIGLGFQTRLIASLS